MVTRARGTRPVWTLFVAAAAVAAALTVSSRAHADAQADFEKARAAYRAHSYDDAESRFSALLDPKAAEKLELAVASQARMYLGATYLAEKRKDDAERVWEKLLVADPGFDPDPLTFPTDVLNTFIDTRARIRQRLNDAAAAQARLDAEKRARDELEKKRQAERLRILEQMAQEEKITVRHSRLVASMPFGAGQFQNGQNALGWVFLGLESALVIGTAVTVPIYINAIDRRNQEHVAGDPDHKETAYVNRAQTAQVVNLSLAGGLALVMAGGILQAHLGFVPESAETKVRSIPQAKLDPAGPGGPAGPAGPAGLTMSPWFTVTPETGQGGSQRGASGALGLRGTF
jgi:tetratricopeptide (TPR) repeat protein